MGTEPCTLSGNANPTITATFSTTTGATCPTGQFRAEYFNNTTLAGTPVLVRCEGAIQHDWGSEGPGMPVRDPQPMDAGLDVTGWAR